MINPEEESKKIAELTEEIVRQLTTIPDVETMPHEQLNQQMKQIIKNTSNMPIPILSHEQLNQQIVENMSQALVLTHQQLLKKITASMDIFIDPLINTIIQQQKQQPTEEPDEDNNE
jgi:hypothetical protein